MQARSHSKLVACLLRLISAFVRQYAPTDTTPEHFIALAPLVVGHFTQACGLHACRASSVTVTSHFTLHTSHRPSTAASLTLTLILTSTLILTLTLTLTLTRHTGH